jgi:hypothetical protein
MRRKIKIKRRTDHSNNNNSSKVVDVDETSSESSFSDATQENAHDERWQSLLHRDENERVVLCGSVAKLKSLFGIARPGKPLQMILTCMVFCYV